jgi:hypothetical protein
MNAFTRSSILLSLLSAAAVAQESPPPPQEHCPASVGITDIAAVLGTDLRIQPVFSPEGLKGWRIYRGAGKQDQMQVLGIPVGSLMTHICGFAARDVEASGGKVTCRSTAPCQYEVTFIVEGKERKVRIERAAVKTSS